jgi:hypothetical protein
VSRKISDIKGHDTGKIPEESEARQTADLALFADGRQAMAATGTSALRMARKLDESDEDATGEETPVHPEDVISDSVDMGGDQPMLLAQADIGTAGTSGSAAAAAQSSPYSAGPPPWVWVAGGLGAAVAGGAIIASSSGSDDDSASPPAPPVNAVPVFTSGATGTVVEHAAVSTVIYDANATDSSTITYSLKPTGDGALLNINPITGEVTLDTPADYETKASYSFTVIASDDTNNSAEQPVTVSVTDVNEHVVVELAGAFIDLNGNGIQDSDDTTPAVFSVGGNADLTTNAVTIEFNNLPTTPIDLSGFNMDDKIEIDVQAFIDNGHIGIAPIADPDAITLDQFTAYTNITANGLFQAYFTSGSLEIYAIGRTTASFTSFGVWLSNMSLLKYQSGASVTLASFNALNITVDYPLQAMVDFIVPPEAV